MMNDPQVNEAARVLAERLMTQPSARDEKIETAFRQILCRSPKQAELDVLIDFFESEKTRLATRERDADQLTDIGEYRHENVSDRTALVALMEVIMTLYNMEETIVRT
ncbi:hypothetical protein D3C83_60420 [compost metagenome]